HSECVARARSLLLLGLLVKYSRLNVLLKEKAWFVYESSLSLLRLFVKHRLKVLQGLLMRNRCEMRARTSNSPAIFHASGGATIVFSRFPVLSDERTRAVGGFFRVDVGRDSGTRFGAVQEGQDHT
ncbi:unnamed protein product, partial [Ectocarpus fasciculatus]